MRARSRRAIRDATSAAAVLGCAVGLALPAIGQAHGAAVVTHADTPAQLADVSVTAGLAAARMTGVTSTADADAGLAAGAWCGTPTSADDSANSPYPSSAAAFKVIYAYPSDRPDRFSQWAGVLQANAAIISQYFAVQPGGTRAPRFDLGTSCGSEYLDIQTVALPGTRAAYGDSFAAVTDAVRAKLGPAPGGPRNYVILADALGSTVSGRGEVHRSAGADRPDAANPHNAGGLFTLLWVTDTVAPPGSPAGGWNPTMMLHEMTHNLGAVQYSAPHTSHVAGDTVNTPGHCWDGYDVMCYADSPNMPHAYVSDVCASRGGLVWQSYDCNQDDYFSPAPAPGSYLDTHWNVYDSVFLGECAALGTCAPAGAPEPLNTAAPTVSAVSAAGQDALAAPGVWSIASTYAYQWQRCERDCVTIAGATDRSYRVSAADAGFALRVAVTATTAAGASGQAVSARTAVIGAGVGAAPLVSVSAPVLSGTPRPGGALIVLQGAWSRTVSTVGAQWQRCQPAGDGCADIPAARDLRYVVTDADVGSALRVRLVAVTADGQEGVATSGFVLVTAIPGPSGPPAPALTGKLSVTGPARTGARLSGRGAWGGQVTSVRSQWLRCAGACAPVRASGRDYRLGAGDVGSYLMLRETATGPGGVTVAYAQAVGPVSSPLAGSRTLRVAGRRTALRSAKRAVLGTATLLGPAPQGQRLRVLARRPVRVIACRAGRSGVAAPWQACTRARRVRRAATMPLPAGPGAVRVIAMPTGRR